MLLTTSRCPVCRRPGGAPCAECVELFTPLGPAPPPPGLDALYAGFAYEDAARPIITGVKYRNQRVAVGWIAEAMVAVLPIDPRPQVITWAPTTAARRRERGFDQSELLARAVARRLRVPVRRLLVRRSSPVQTGRSGADRRADAPRFALARRSVPRSVLLVDDVVTTGSTLSAASAALRSGGASFVAGLVAAATPPPAGPNR
jgi:ComF family protein